MRAGGGASAHAPVDASSPFQPPPGNPRFPLVDSLRGIAALAVLLAHVDTATVAYHPFAAATTGGWLRTFMTHLNVGVPIFFVISGFVLYRPFVAGRQGKAPAVRVADYARRRALRILPGYWVALTVLALAPGLGDVFTADFWRRYGLVSQWLPLPGSACERQMGSCGIAPAWSLSIEMGFYVLLPLCALGIARLVRNARQHWSTVELGTLGALVLASYVLMVTAYHGSVYWIARGPLGLAGWFVGGMAIAVISVRFVERPTAAPLLRRLAATPWLFWAGAAVTYAAICALLPLASDTQTMHDRAVYYLLFGVCGLLVVASAIVGTVPADPVQRLLRSRPLRSLGLISYGVFLYHYPIVFGLERIGADRWLGLGPSFTARTATLTVVALALTIPAATISYLVVERPFLRLKPKPQPSGYGAIGHQGLVGTPLHGSGMLGRLDGIAGSEKTAAGRG